MKKGKGGWASPHQDLLSIVALAKEVGNGRRNRKKLQFQEIFRRLNQPNLLTYEYLAFWV